MVSFSLPTNGLVAGVVVICTIFSAKMLSTLSRLGNFLFSLFKATDKNLKSKISEQSLDSGESGTHSVFAELLQSKLKCASDSIFLHIYNGIYLTMHEASDADKMAQHKLYGKRIIIPFFSRGPNPSRQTFIPSSLAEIFKFDEMMRGIHRHNPSHSIVLCAGVDPFVQAKAIFLAGCHMMMTQGFSYAETVAAFAKARTALPNTGRMESDESSVDCCWFALYRAKSLGWIDFGDIFDTGCDNPSRIFIEEYIHYAR